MIEHLKRKSYCDSGSSAVEFALICPVMLAIVFGISCYGYIFCVVHSVQQLSSEAARASVAGMSDTERDGLARSFVTANLASYPLLSSNLLQVTTSGTGSPNYIYQVSLSYDLSTSFVFQFSRFLPLPTSSIRRSAVVQRGGY